MIGSSKSMMLMKAVYDKLIKNHDVDMETGTEIQGETV